MKLLFSIEIDSKEWDNETFDDSNFDKKTLESMLFDRFYDLLTDILKVNDFSDYIEYEPSNKAERKPIEQLKEQMTEEQFKKLEDLLEDLRKETKFSLGYHRISGSFCQYEVLDFNEKEIVVLLEYGKVDDGSDFSERYREGYRIDRNTLEFINRRQNEEDDFIV